MVGHLLREYEGAIGRSRLDQHIAYTFTCHFYKNSPPICFQGGTVDLQSQTSEDSKHRTKISIVGRPRSLAPLQTHHIAGIWFYYLYTTSEPTSHLHAAANGECFRMGHALDCRTRFRFIDKVQTLGDLRMRDTAN